MVYGLTLACKAAKDLPVVCVCVVPGCLTAPTPMDGKELTDFCAPVMTLSGCECHANWRLDGTSYYGSCANTGDPLGSWCVVDKTTCPSSYRAHGYGAKTVTASVVGVAANLTGQDFDYWCGLDSVVSSVGTAQCLRCVTSCFLLQHCCIQRVVAGAAPGCVLTHPSHPDRRPAALSPVQSSEHHQQVPL